MATLSDLGIKDPAKVLRKAHRMRKHGLVAYESELGWLYIFKDRENYVAGSPIDTRIELLYRNDEIVGVKLYLTPKMVGHPL